VFVGGENFQLSISSGTVGGVAWFPLGPREVYQPAYPVSRRYFQNINQSNTVINNTVINNYYNNTNVTNVVYANRQVPGAVVAVPATSFVQSQPVSRVAVQVSPDVMVKAPVAVVPPLAPTEKSVRGNAAQGDIPPARVLERSVVVRTAPPAPRVGFAAQQPQLAAKPGKPLDDDARRELKPAATAPVVKVVAETKVAPPSQRLPPATARIAPSDARGRADDRRSSAAPVTADDTRARTTQATAPPQAARPAPIGRPPEQRGRSEQPAKTLSPGPPDAVTVAEPKAAPPPPAVQSPQQRTRPEQPGKWSQPAQPVATLPPQQAAQPQMAPAPPVASPMPPERARAEQPGKGSQRAQHVATPPTPQSAAQSKAAPVPDVASPTLTAPQPAKIVPAVKPAQPEPASSEGPRGQRAGLPAGKASDLKQELDEQKRDADERLKKEQRETEERLKRG
jgi:hypothetical protein